MSQVGRPIKSLEAPRPLKSISRPMLQSASYEVQSIEELITLTENVAAALAQGQSNADSMSILLANLRVHGPQLEAVSKDTLDRAFVTFRNASQDERLTIIARMNLLELIELRAKSWQISDGLNTYYKHKATDVQPDMTAMIDLTMLGSSPPTGLNPAVPMLSPGELLRNSGKFTKPTKIPGKNYSKDEVVIRNADSGKVMGIKGRRVHMIEELSETIISFQRVNPGAKERLVQITGPTEEKILYAKQLIEETIRRNASPVRLDAPQGGGSCSSLASSTSDDAAAAAAASAANRNSQLMAASNMAGQFGVSSLATAGGHHHHNSNNNTAAGLSLKMPRTPSSAGQQLLHSLSTNDASLGEYKYTVGVGNHSVKITGDCFELVRIAKLVLDDYFSSSDFLASVEAGAAYDSGVTTPTTPSVMIPVAHQLNSASPFVDSGVGLNYMGQSGRSLGMMSTLNNNNSTEVDDDVFIIENEEPITPSLANSTPINGLTRSRRSHFSRKDSTPENNGFATSANSSLTSLTANASASSLTALSPNDSARSSMVVPTHRIVHEYERMIYYAKSPHSWALPANWANICERFPTITRNKDTDDQKNRFDADKHMATIKSNRYAKVTPATPGNHDDDSSATPDPE